MNRRTFFRSAVAAVASGGAAVAAPANVEAGWVTFIDDDNEAALMASALQKTALQQAFYLDHLEAALVSAKAAVGKPKGWK